MSTHSTGRSFRVALTGGIASGKTSVAETFIALGIPVFDTDQIARDVVEPGTPALAQIAAHFGSEYIDPNGRLDRRRLREHVFSNPDDRMALEAITHPAIRQELARRASTVTAPYQVHAIPLFTEGGARGNYDRVLVVDCPEEIQVRRVMQRDGVDEQQARRVLTAQTTREKRLAIATDVVINDTTLDALKAQVDALHRRYLVMAETKHRLGINAG